MKRKREKTLGERAPEETQQGPSPDCGQRGPPPDFRQQGPSSSSSSRVREEDTQLRDQEGEESTQAEAGSPPPKASLPEDGLKKKEIIPYVGKVKIPKRKGTGGTLGRPVMLEVNYLPLKIKLDGEAIHYDCAIDPDTPKAVMPKVFEKIRLAEFPNRHPAFDGRRNMYSSGLIKFRNGKTASGEVSVIMESGDMKVYKYAITEGNRIYFSQLAMYMKDGLSTQSVSVAKQALDIALGSTPLYRSLQVGKSFFKEPGERPFDLGEGMVLRSGHFQSAIMVTNKSYLNVDVANKAFPKGQPIIDYIKNDLGATEEQMSQGLSTNIEEKMRRFLKGLKVKYSFITSGRETFKKSYRVVDVTTPPETIKFECNGVVTSVKDYFWNEKKYKIKYNQLPCLQVGRKERNTQVPMELCSIVEGQAVMKQLTERQTAIMVQQAATKPLVRRKKIMDSVRSVGFRNDPCLKEFGIEVEEKFARVSARVLDPPILEYKGGKTAKPVHGQWKANRLHYYRPVELKRWVVLNLCPYIHNRVIEDAVKLLINAGTDTGVVCRDPTIDDRPDLRSSDECSLLSYLKHLKRQTDTQMVLVIMDHVYAQVKRSSEIYVGILTQCVKGDTIKRFNYIKAYNMMLKINTKLNGINHIISKRSNMAKCLPRNAMFIGADVTHPSPDKSDIPSIAAVAASYDESFVHYNVISRLQGPRVEIIDEFCDIMMNQLRHYLLRNGKYPENLFFFRDGVSESQFDPVLNHELLAVRKACRSIRKDYKPKMTFMVVQKRHHARLFPVNERDGDRNGNIQAGTIVDKQIVHPTEMEFFLASHASIQGTCRPTKYHVLYDDSEMTEDELEHLTYYLCFLFPRCNRSVSYTAPTYIAHLAAFRSRKHIEGIRVDVNDLSKEQRHLSVVDKLQNSNPMFFVYDIIDKLPCNLL